MPLNITGEQLSGGASSLTRPVVRLRLAIGLLLVLHAAGVASAGTSRVIKLPRSPKPPKCGLRMTVDTTWVIGPGYRPVRVEINSTTGPVSFDRELFVQISPDNWDGLSGGIYAGTTIEISEGSATAVETLLVPEFCYWQSLSIFVYEDGRRIEELSMTGLDTDHGQDFSELMPRVLVIHKDAPLPEDRGRWVRIGRMAGRAAVAEFTERDLPDLRGWGKLASWNLADAAAPRGKATGAEILAVVEEQSRLELLAPDRLPENWVGLTSVDVVMISMGDLRDLKQRYPARFNALRTAAAAGSVLCVWDVGDQFERLKELEGMLELKSLPADGSELQPFRDWSTPDRAVFTERVVIPDEEAVYSSGLVIDDDGWMMTEKDEKVIDRLAAAVPPAGRTPFRFRPIGLGTVVGMADENPFPGSTGQWYWLLRSIPDYQWQWGRRNGMSLSRRNGDFWNFLIPGVGMPPVTFFRVLITVFVVVIGPVNYVLLRRWGRMHLLLVTVPAGAMLVLTGLFLYAFLADGLGVRARVRSFTLLDQQKGESIAWSRHMYYAGLAPSGGLTFPRSSTVYPLICAPYVELDGWRDKTRRVRWDGEQQLTGSWLRSRTISQFMVVSADRTEISLDVRPAGHANEPPEVTNRLGGRIIQVCVCDEKGQYFAAEDVAGGEVFRPRPVPPDGIANVFGVTPKENRLEQPNDVVLARYGDMYRRSRWDYRSGYGPSGQTTAPTTETSVLERNLALVEKGGESLEPRSYIAVVERCETVPLGVESREEMGYHVIRGSW